MSDPAGTFEFLGHTADEGFDLRAASYPGILAAGLGALFAVVGPAPEGVEVEVRIAVAGLDREDLLVRFLQDALVRWALEGLYPVRIEAIEVAASEQGWSARARAVCRRIDGDDRQGLVEVKAVTYHHLRVEQEADGSWRARVILDL